FACFSLHPVKTITMGEGGVTTTSDSAAFQRMSRFRSHGMVREAAQFEQRALAFAPDGEANPWYYEMPEPGFNYRATDFACALGLSQLGKLTRFATRRREMRSRYDRLLKPLAPIVRPVRPTSGDAVLHLYAVLIEFDMLGLDRAAAMRRLKDEGIGTMVHYLPVHMQPYYRHRYGTSVLEGAEAYYRRVLSIPFYPGMSDADIDRVVAALERLARRAHAA
ncbi:MAG: DegT/DnrJ/EryC1/StrS family aminotransferase, partial [Alphaproteobacteria bacterium]|nr:DegT/DnrJ/EryC1/StrS family aminotransferase [Alphaproteobacteria bacterium]